MSSLVLPQELVNIIIDEVGRLNDIPTLRSCSLTALGFVYPAQQHLFRVIDLDQQTPRKKAFQRFYRLLNSKPYLGAHVRELRIGDDTDEDNWRASKKTAWVAKAKDLPRLLQLLPKLRAFSLTFNSEMTPWSSLSVSNQTAISKLFDLDSLRTVSLEFMTAIPATVVSKLYRLKALGLSCVEVDTAPNTLMSVKGIAPSFTSLETLHLRGTTPATITTMVRLSEQVPSGTSKLQRLSITPTFEAGFCDTVFELMKHHRNITQFEWLPSIHFSASAGSIDLNILPSLRTLTLLVSFRKTSSGHGPFSEALRLLKQLSSSDAPNQIETVILDCHCIRSSDAKTRKMEWRPMDKLLSKSTFANLKEVKVQLAATTCSAVERSNFVLAFQNLLPKVEERGTLISLHNYDRIPDDRFFMPEMRSVY